MQNLPPLVELRAFDAAARHLSFKKAAEELGVTPTAISHQIRLLERHCRCALFRRRPRPLSLTEAGARVFGPRDPSIRGGAVSFWYREVHPHDLATILNEEGVAIRAGHHCAQLVMRRFDTPATARASFYVYNTREEVDVLIDALAKAEDVFL